MTVTADVLLRQIIAVHNAERDVNRKLQECKELHDSLNYDDPRGDRAIVKEICDVDRFRFLRYRGCAVTYTVGVGVVCECECDAKCPDLPSCLADTRLAYEDLCDLEMDLEELQGVVGRLYDYLADQREVVE